MNLLDYVIIVMLVLLTVKGVFRGFFREISSLAGIILGIWLGNRLHPQLAEIFKQYISFSNYLPLISFAVIFTGVLIFANLAGCLLHFLFKKVFLGWFDKILGAGLAVVKCTIIIYFIIIMQTFFIPAATPLVANSVLAPWVIRSYQTMAGIISPEQYKKLTDRLQGEKSISEILTGKTNDNSKNDE